MSAGVRTPARCPSPAAEPASAAPPARMRRPEPPVAELPPGRRSPPSTRDRMEAAFGAAATPGDASWTTRGRILAQARPRRGPALRGHLPVSRPGDPLEREAGAVAARAAHGALAPAGPANRPHHVGAPARALPAARARGPPAPWRAPAAVLAGAGPGRPLDSSLRARLEPHVGVDLANVSVHSGPHAAAAARALRARAFTSGSAIFLSASASPTEVGLMAHEAAHVAQQDRSPAARATVMRQAEGAPAASDAAPAPASSLILDWVIEGALESVRALPGYTLLTVVTGVDPITGARVEASRERLIEELLTYGPFGAAVGQVLQAIDVLDDVFDVVSAGLAANNLTAARLSRDIDAAKGEFRFALGISGNFAIVERYVDALLGDVRAFVDGIVDRVIEIVRAAAADVVEPLLQTPEVQPVWSLARKVLHYDPLRGEPVEAATVDILADFLRLIGEEERLAQMQERGTLQETADWLDTQFATFASLLDELGTLFSDAWEAIRPENLPDLLTNVEALARRAFALVGRVGEFAATVILKVLELVKESLLGWLAEHANSVPGFHLLTVILGRNPFTGEVVPRTAENLIKGFITLLPNGEQTYEQLAEAGVIGQAAERIETAMSALGITWDLVTGTFRGIWDTLSLDDLLDPVGAFNRIVAQFGEPLGRIVEFVQVVVEVVITLILRLMNFPSDLLGSIIANATQAIRDIQRDPVGFLLNMLEAVKLGFSGFFGNILGYLMQGLVDWLFRGLRQLGITIPPDLTFASVLNLVLQVLGVTVELLWQKLGEHIGPERVAMIRGALDMLTGAWQFIRDVQEGGAGAVWRYVTDQLGMLWDALLQMARDWIVETIVRNVTARLLSMLDPTGVMAVVNSFIAFFNAVQSAIEYLREILQIIDQYVRTFAQIAAGNIVPGAQMLERGLANAIPVAIGFLANQVGIGNVPEKIVELIQQLRALVDEALDWLFEQAIRLGESALRALGIGAEEEEAAAEPAGPGGVKRRAEGLLRAGLGEARTRVEIETLVGSVSTQLQPEGLDALELRGPDADGKYEIFAAASEFERLVDLIPPLGGPRAVVLETRLELYEPDVSLERSPAFGAVRIAARGPGGEILQKPEGVVMTTTQFTAAPVIPFGRGTGSTVSGGVALPPVPGSGRISLTTYNTSDNPRSDSNLTHAERQLQEVLERDRALGRQVREINAEINWSPCALCSSTLSTIARLTPRAERRVLRWYDLYRHPTRGTTDESLSEISGWDIYPPAVTEEGLAELEAAAWAAL